MPKTTVSRTCRVYQLEELKKKIGVACMEACVANFKSNTTGITNIKRIKSDALVYLA